jgi:hypothetical protein
LLPICAAAPSTSAALAGSLVTDSPAIAQAAAPVISMPTDIVP